MRLVNILVNLERNDVLFQRLNKLLFVIGIQLKYFIVYLVIDNLICDSKKYVNRISY